MTNDHDYAREAQERWGDTPAFEESARRTAGYGPDEWNAIRAEADEIAGRFASLAASGADPGSEVAATVVEAHRRHIDRWFYPCSPPMHASLAELYVTDPRFAAYWDGFGEGTAQFVRDAVAAAADPAE